MRLGVRLEGVSERLKGFGRLLASGAGCQIGEAAKLELVGNNRHAARRQKVGQRCWWLMFSVRDVQ